jgi:hypothetical protein
LGSKAKSALGAERGLSAQYCRRSKDVPVPSTGTSTRRLSGSRMGIRAKKQRPPVPFCGLGSSPAQSSITTRLSFCGY